MRERYDRNIPAGRLADDYDMSVGAIYYHVNGNCSHTGEGTSRGRPKSASVRDFCKILQETDEHVLTTGEVNERLPVPYQNTQSVLGKLLEHSEEHPIEYKKTAQSYVWWWDDE